MTFSTIWDESLSSTFVKTYMSKQTTTTPYYIKIDATNSPPYPGVRWIAVYMASNGKGGNSYLPIYVWPKVMPAASLTQPELKCTDND